VLRQELTDAQRRVAGRIVMMQHPGSGDVFSHADNFPQSFQNIHGEFYAKFDRPTLFESIRRVS